MKRNPTVRSHPKIILVVTLALGLTLVLAACGEANTATPPTSNSTVSAPVVTTTPPSVSVKLGVITPVVDYWPVYVAQSKGFFDKQGLKIELIYFDTSSKSVQALASNSVDMTTSSTDTIINAVEKGATLIQVAGIYNKATYSLVVGKDIKSYADLKGKTLAVSDLKDGSTLLLQKMLAANSLKTSDYNLVALGGTSKRAGGITAGQVAGALIGLPNNVTLENDGYPSLGYTTDTVKEYQWESLAVQRDWAQKNGDTIVRFIKAMNEAQSWLYNPANKDEATAILAKELKVTSQVAAKTYDQAIVKLQAVPQHSEFNIEGFKTVIQIMGELELLKAPLPAPDKYIDTSFLDKARKG